MSKKLFENVGGNQFQLASSLKEQAGSKVFVLLERTNYEGDTLIGVYSSEQGAEKGKAEYIQEWGDRATSELITVPVVIDGPILSPF